MSERSMGSEFDRKRVDGGGEQRRQQNQQSNQAGGQQGSSGGSLGAGPMTSARDAGMEGGAVSTPGPGREGLADQVNHGLAQADPQKSVGPQRVKQAGNDAPAESGGTANRPGDANGSGSMGSTRRDDPPRAPQR